MSAIGVAAQLENQSLDLPAGAEKGTDIAPATAVSFADDDSTLDYDDYVKKYRVKKWILLVFFALQSIFAGPTFFNFAPFQDMFYDNNAYANLCHPGDEVDDTYHACLAQRQRIAALLPAATSCMFSFSFVGGILVDTVGPKMSCLFGLICQALGWLFMAFASNSFDGYKVGLVFLGLGIDPMFISLLPLGNLFENWSNTIVSILGTSRSLSMGVGMVFRKMGGSVSLKATCIGYCVIIVVCLILSAYLVPWEPFPDRTAFALAKDREDRSKHSVWQKIVAEIKTQVKVFLEYGWSLSFILIVFVSIVTFVRNNYYSSSIPEQLPQAKSYYELMNVLSMIPCPFLGLLSDRVNIDLVMVILNASGALVMGLLLAKSSFAQYLSATFQWLVMSFLTSEFFCYCGSRFPQNVFGKVVGFVLLVGGNFANLSTPMYNYSSSHNDFHSLDIVLMALSLACMGIVMFLYFYRRRKTVADKKATDEVDV